MTVCVPPVLCSLFVRRIEGFVGDEMAGGLDIDEAVLPRPLF